MASPCRSAPALRPYRRSAEDFAHDGERRRVDVELSGLHRLDGLAHGHSIRDHRLGRTANGVREDVAGQFDAHQPDHRHPPVAQEPGRDSVDGRGVERAGVRGKVVELHGPARGLQVAGDPRDAVQPERADVGRGRVPPRPRARRLDGPRGSAPRRDGGGHGATTGRCRTALRAPAMHGRTRCRPRRACRCRGSSLDRGRRHSPPAGRRWARPPIPPAARCGRVRGRGAGAPIPRGADRRAPACACRRHLRGAVAPEAVAQLRWAGDGLLRRHQSITRRQEGVLTGAGTYSR